MIKSIRILVVMLFAISFNMNDISAQISNLNDISGTVLKQQNYFEVSGSPYMYATWVKGNVTFANGKIVKDIGLKYDLVKDELLFAGKNNQEYYFNDSIKEFTLIGEKDNVAIYSLFRNGFPVVKNLSASSFYEIIVDGEVQLLKKNIKTISETKEFNSATTVKNINENSSYYIAKPNSIVQLKRDDMKALANALDNQKSSAILEFSAKNKLNPKKEEDLKKVLAYYNSIK
ncbi:MAG: hypothetical protein V4663_10460 [Bacteroidota bacterium]